MILYIRYTIFSRNFVNLSNWYHWFNCNIFNQCWNKTITSSFVSFSHLLKLVFFMSRFILIRLLGEFLWANDSARRNHLHCIFLGDFFQPFLHNNLKWTNSYFSCQDFLCYKDRFKRNIIAPCRQPKKTAHYCKYLNFRLLIMS